MQTLTPGLPCAALAGACQGRADELALGDGHEKEDADGDADAHNQYDVPRLEQQAVLGLLVAAFVQRGEGHARVEAAERVGERGGGGVEGGGVERNLAGLDARHDLVDERLLIV